MPLNRQDNRTRAIFAGSAVLLTVLGLTAQDAGPNLHISHRARLVAPGEVVLIDVVADVPVSEVGATWRGRSVPLYVITETRWEGLVPIDLANPPGPYTLEVRATTSAGRDLQQRYDLVVEAKRFEVRQLKVAPRFVEPPAEALSRIARERDQVERVLAHVTEERLWTGAFVLPVLGPATSSFGRLSVLNGKRRSQHAGTDFRAGTGTPVRAPAGGRVALVGDHYFSGGTLVLDHGLGVYSYFAHLSDVLVAAGDVVDRSQIVARSGATGRVTGPHLHWSMRVAGARVDPLSLVALLGERTGSDP
jgi:murein DD-endopeptidase MepM/ murein hydrolase activator NlpD